MQSLVLATSLVLGVQNPVIDNSVEQDVANFIERETSRVTQYVHYKETTAAKNTMLQRAKIVIQQAKQDRANRLQVNLTVAE